VHFFVKNEKKNVLIFFDEIFIFIRVINYVCYLLELISLAFGNFIASTSKSNGKKCFNILKFVLQSIYSKSKNIKFVNMSA
jgi:hypothetical protein